MDPKTFPQIHAADQAANWTAAELTQRDDFRWSLTEAEQDELRFAVGEWANRFPDEPAERLASMTSTSFPLPSLDSKLKRIQSGLENGPGVAWLEGVNIEDWSERETAIAFQGLSSHLGTAVSQNTRGDTLFHVRDEGLPDGHPAARGPSSNRTLTFHTDRCDVIGFLCMQQAKQGGDNDVVSSLRLYTELCQSDPDLVVELMKPYLYQRHNVDGGNDLPYYDLPVFSFQDGRFACFLLRVLIERAYAAVDTPDMTPQQRAALDRLADLAEEERLRYRFRQQRGDLLFVNNFVTLHRRTGFIDYESSERRRHLLRTWLAVPNSRPLVPAFRAAFGATDAGAIRGGMKPVD